MKKIHFQINLNSLDKLCKKVQYKIHKDNPLILMNKAIHKCKFKASNKVQIKSNMNKVKQKFIMVKK